MMQALEPKDDMADKLLALLLSQPTEAFPSVNPVHAGPGKPPVLEAHLAEARDRQWADYCAQTAAFAHLTSPLVSPLGGHHEALAMDDSSSPVIDSAPTVIDEAIEDGAYEPDEPEPEEVEPEPEPEPRSLSAPQHGGSRSWASVASKAQPEGVNNTVSTQPQPVPVAAVPAATPTSAPASPTPASPQTPAPQVVSPAPAPVTRESVNPRDFDWETNSKKARHFVIKSYTEDDVRQSLRFNVWASTDGGNRRLDAAYREHHSVGPVYLYFSVNGSGHFCGMAQMTSPLDFSKKVDVWASDKWNGCFTIRWIFVRNIPNNACRHIRLDNNEGKPVTNSRDTQEVLAAPGRELLRIIATYSARSSLLDKEKSDASVPAAAAAPALAPAPSGGGKGGRRKQHD